MTEDARPEALIHEAVASFPTRAAFRDAVARLLAAGFAPSDLSVLTSHDSLEIAGAVAGYPGRPGSSLMAGLTDEVVFLAPLTIAGFVLLSGGAVAVALAALVSAGLGGAALKEILDRYTANRHSADFVAALASGSVLLWVRVEDAAREKAALQLLEAAGGRQAHVHVRPEVTAPARP